MIMFIISEGKVAIAEKTPAKFNQEASKKYKNLLPEEKEKLKCNQSIKMDVRSILRTGEKLFEKIQKLVSVWIFSSMPVCVLVWISGLYVCHWVSWSEF